MEQGKIKNQEQTKKEAENSSEIPEEISFEGALKRLKEQQELVKSGELTLEESIQAYEEGMKYYAVCDRVLKSAKQKIETFDEED